MPTGSRTKEGSCDNLENAPVAQLDRVVASEAIGRGFESLRARQFRYEHWRNGHTSIKWRF